MVEKNRKRNLIVEIEFLFLEFNILIIIYILKCQKLSEWENFALESHSY